MGCDIHMHVEYMFNDKWRCGDYFELDYRSTPDRCIYRHVNLYSNRNYALSSVLANVRNYANNEYIDDPRGFPEDCTQFVKDDYNEWNDHSVSYFTLKELIDFHRRAAPLKRTGLLNPSQLNDFDNYGILPSSWCQGTNIEGYERRNWEEPNEVLVPLIDKLIDRADELGVIYGFQFTDDYGGTGYDLADNIRIVFWFDN